MILSIDNMNYKTNAVKICVIIFTEIRKPIVYVM